MLRQKEGFDASIDALSMLGLTGNAAAEDEIVVFSSRDLMYQTVDALDLWDANSVRGGRRWIGEFRHPALKVDYLALNENGKKNGIIVTVQPTKSGFRVKTKAGRWHRSSCRVESLDEPIETAAGTLLIHANRPLSTDTTYRVIHSSKASVVDGYRRQIKVAQHKKESNIITLTATSTMPERDAALI